MTLFLFFFLWPEKITPPRFLSDRLGLSTLTPSFVHFGDFFVACFSFVWTCLVMSELCGCETCGEFCSACGSACRCMSVRFLSLTLLESLRAPAHMLVCDGGMLFSTFGSSERVMRGFLLCVGILSVCGVASPFLLGLFPRLCVMKELCRCEDREFLYRM